MKDGVELSRDGKYRIKKEGKKHWLIINEATKEDIGMYHVYTSGGESKGELEVEGISNSVCFIANGIIVLVFIARAVTMKVNRRRTFQRSQLIRMCL